MKVDEVKAGIVSMAGRIYDMLELIEKGFMEHKTEFLSKAMAIEKEINETEKILTGNILELSKSISARDKKNLSVLQQIVESLERMGDEAASMVERIEIKVTENLLFSETGVDQFLETYHAMKKSVEMMRGYLKSRDPGLKENIVNNGFHVKDLVERYRSEHSERLVQGLCTPMGANMYFDLLDFTGNLARHSSNIVKLF